MASWSTLVQVMTCCRMAPNHYLKQCWSIISEVLWHQLRAILHDLIKNWYILDMSLKIINLRLQPWSYFINRPWNKIHALYIHGLAQDCSNSLKIINLRLQLWSYFINRPWNKIHALYIDGLAQDCSNSNANALELLQSCTKPSISYCSFRVISLA